MTRPIGEARVDVHADTSSVRNEITDGVQDGMKGQGTEAGKTFSGEFDKESSRGIAGVASRLGNLISTAIGNAGTAAGRNFSDKFTAVTNALGRNKIPAPDLDTKLLEARIGALTARLQKLSTMKATPTVEANTAVAMANLARLEARLAGITAKKHIFDIRPDTRSLTQSLVGLASLSRAIFTLSIPVAALGVTPAVASLGASAVQAAGAMYLLPAAGAAAALGIGTLVTGLSNMADALGPTGTPAQLKKVQEAMAQLAPQARATVLEIRALSDEWSALRVAVQGRLFQGISDDVQPLAATYLPMLRAAMEQVAGGFNRGATELIAFLRSSAGITDMQSGIRNTADATTTLTGVIAPLGRALLDIFVVGSGYVKQYAGEIVSLAVRFEEYISKARASGELNRIIEQAIVIIGQLLQLAINLGSILGAIFDAGQAAAGSFLQTLVMVTGRISEFLNSAEGQDALVALFKAIHETAAAALPGILALGAAIAKSIIVLGPVLPQIGAAFSALAIAAGPFIVAMAELAAVILPPIIALIQQFAPVLGPAIAAFGAMYVAASLLGGLLGIFDNIAKVIRLVSVAQTAWTAAVWLFNAAMNANPIVRVVTIIIALVGALITAYQTSETFRAIVDGAFRAVVSAIQVAIDWFKQLPERIGEAITAAGNWFRGLYDSAVAVGVSIGNWLSNLPTMISNGLSSLGATISSAASTAWNWLVTSAINAGNATLAFLADLPGNIAYGLGFLAGTIARAAVDAFMWLWTGAVQAWDATYAFLMELPGRIATWAVNLGTSIYNSAASAWQRLTEAWDAGWAATMAWLDALPGRLAVWAVTLGLSLYEAGSNAWARFQAALDAAIAATINFFVALPGRLIAGLAALGVLLYDTGVNAINSLMSGITGTIYIVATWFASLPGLIIGFLGDAGSWLYSAGVDIINGLMRGLTGTVAAIWSWITEMTNQFIQGFKDAFGISSPSTLFSQFGTWVLEGFLNGLTIMVDVIMAFVTGFIQRFIDGFNTLLTMWTTIWSAIQAATIQILTAVVTYIQQQIQNVLDFVTATLNAVSTFWSSIWGAISSYTSTVLSAIYTFISQQIQNVYNFIQTTFNAAYQFWMTIWNAIRSFGEALWNALVAFYQSGFTNWRGLFEAVLTAMRAFWETIWNAIRAFGEQIWNAIYAFFQTGLNNFNQLITTVMNAIFAFWQQIWTSIRTYAENLWNAFSQFITNALNALRQLFDTVMNALRVAWETVWTAIRTFAETAWRNFQTFITGGLATFKAGWDSFWNGISTGFRTIWDGIQAVARTAWETLNTNFRGGINLVIDAVNWPIDKINGLFGINIPKVPRLASGGTIDIEGLATGGNTRPGRVSGIGGRTADRVPTMLSRDEHVWSAAEVNAAGGHDEVRRMRAAVMSRAFGANQDPNSTSLRQGLARRKAMDNVPNLDDLGRAMLAYGGVLPHVARAGDAVTAAVGGMPGGIGGVGARGNVSDHPLGLALDFMSMGNLGLGDRVANFLSANWAQLGVKYLIWKQRIASSPGAWRPMADRGSITANHFDHVHASFNRAPGVGGLVEVAGNFLANMMPSFDGILEGAKGMLGGMFGGRPGWWISLAGAFLDKAWEGMKNKATEMWNGLFGGGGGDTGPVGAAPPGAGVQRWAPTVLAALARVGQPASLLPVVLRRMQQESGGDPNIQNNWDINAKNGVPSRGLMQVIAPTFAAHRDPQLSGNILDPMANIVASMRYAMSRYGSLSAAYNRPGGYDNGGWLEPGFTLAANGTGKREAVIADPMTTFERSFKNIFKWLAPDMEAALRAGNTTAFDQIIRRLGGEREVGSDIIRAYNRMPRWAQELINNQFPSIAAAIRSPQVDVVDAIRDLIPVRPVVTPPKPPVIPPVEIPPVAAPQIPTGELGVSFQDALRQFAPELSLALQAGAGDQARFLATEILGNNERLAALSGAMGTDITPILTQLRNSLVAPPPPIPPIVIPQPTWLEREVGRLVSFASANVTRGNNAGDRLEDVGDDFSWQLVRAFELAFPKIETATETSRIDVNRVLSQSGAELLSWLQTRSTAEQVQILEALDGRDRSLTEALAAAQSTVKVEAPAPASPPIIEAGAFQVTIAGNADAVTVDQLRATLVEFNDQILREYEGRN